MLVWVKEQMPGFTKGKCCGTCKNFSFKEMNCMKFLKKFKELQEKNDELWKANEDILLNYCNNFEIKE